jgi:hypothetical protein
VKKSLFFCAFVSLALAPSMKAQMLAGSTQATVLSVRKHQSGTPVVGDNPSDAPLRSEIYSYDIFVRVKCAVLSGHYESAYDYLPSAFAVDHRLPVRVEKHDMLFDVPGYGELKVPIIKRKQEHNASCNEVPAASDRGGSQRNQDVSAIGEAN